MTHAPGTHLAATRDTPSSDTPAPAPQTPQAGRRHTGILLGPTRGHQPPTWGYLFELLVQEGAFPLTERLKLPAHEVDRLADRMVLHTTTVQEAFHYLVQNHLVDITRQGGVDVATANLPALLSILRRQQGRERAGAPPSELSALVYFRARCMWVGLPWLRRVLGKDHDGVGGGPQ